jgi:hypothetical protein
MDLSVQSLRMLGQANEKYEYRYPEHEAGKPQIVLPELDWVKESAGKIFGWVGAEVAAWVAANPVQTGPLPPRLVMLRPTGPIFARPACVALLMFLIKLASDLLL